MPKPMFDLTGRVAIVTGCSGGLGLQMAMALANQGASIVVVARRQNLIDAIAEQLNRDYGVPTLAVRCDITDTDAVNAMVDTYAAASPYIAPFIDINSVIGAMDYPDWMAAYHPDEAFPAA